MGKNKLILISVDEDTPEEKWGRKHVVVSEFWYEKLRANGKDVVLKGSEEYKKRKAAKEWERGEGAEVDGE